MFEDTGRNGEVRIGFGQLCKGSQIYENVPLAHGICMNRKYRERQALSIPEEYMVDFSEHYYRLAMCMAIVSKDGKLLLTKRNSNISFPNAWVMPGGHIDPGETLEEGVVFTFHILKIYFIRTVF